MLKDKSKTHRISKLEAARRQLDTAIQLWFADADIVSVCTLAYAAYEIIHVISKGKRKSTLLFDSDVIREEYRNDWSKWLKGNANFFKHANRDPSGEMDFNPVVSEMLIIFTIRGLFESGVKLNDCEVAFNHWQCFQNPNLIADASFKRFVQSLPVEQLRRVRALKKSEFFEEFLIARKAARKTAG